MDDDKAPPIDKDVERSPFRWFVETCCGEHQRRYPYEKVTPLELTRKCAEAWKGMTELEKKRFYQLASGETQQRRLQAFSTFKTNFYKNRCVRAKRKDPGAPKRPPSAFLLFLHERRNKMTKTDRKAQEAVRELSIMWNAMPIDEKKPYIERATESFDDYKAKVKEYQKTKHNVEESKPKLYRNTHSHQKVCKSEEDEEECFENYDSDSTDLQYEENRLPQGYSAMTYGAFQYSYNSMEQFKVLNSQFAFQNQSFYAAHQSTMQFSAKQLMEQFYCPQQLISSNSYDNMNDYSPMSVSTPIMSAESMEHDNYVQGSSSQCFYE